jgi:hypothetical protein
MSTITKKTLNDKRRSTLAIRDDLYNTCSILGTASENEPDNRYLSEAYCKASLALSEVEALCLAMGYISHYETDSIETCPSDTCIVCKV